MNGKAMQAVYASVIGACLPRIADFDMLEQ